MWSCRTKVITNDRCAVFDSGPQQCSCWIYKVTAPKCHTSSQVPLLSNFMIKIISIFGRIWSKLKKRLSCWVKTKKKANQPSSISFSVYKDIREGHSPRKTARFWRNKCNFKGTVLVLFLSLGMANSGTGWTDEASGRPGPLWHVCSKPRFSPSSSSCFLNDQHGRAISFKGNREMVSFVHPLRLSLNSSLHASLSGCGVSGALCSGSPSDLSTCTWVPVPDVPICTDLFVFSDSHALFYQPPFAFPFSEYYRWTVWKLYHFWLNLLLL